jgi:transcription elongation factor GreB
MLTPVLPCRPRRPVHRHPTMINDSETHAPGLDDESEGDAPVLPRGVKNYITPAGHARLRGELIQLLDEERPELVRTVAWAASNGDRSENGDYIYGKKRLREIDRRIRFLTKRLDNAEIVDPAARESTEQVYFGARVTYVDARGEERTITIVGMDEVDPMRHRVSWIAPVARALLKSRVGDVVSFQSPRGLEELEIVDVHYGAIE